MSRVSITVNNISEISEKLAKINKAVENPDRKFAEAVRDATLNEVERRWFANGDGTWQPLSNATIKRKGNAFPLIDTGNMFNSLTGDIEEKRIIIKVPYGGKNKDRRVPAYHQYGTSKIPKRAILVKTKKMIQTINTMVIRYIEDVIRINLKGVNYEKRTKNS